MAVLVRIPTPLRKVSNGADRAEVDGANLDQVIAVLDQRFPGMRDRLLDESGDIRHFVNIYVNGEDVRFLQGRGTAVKSGDEVSIVPAVAGGR
jgi:molybdopterin synthase sulfur carrier subunit